MLNAEIRFKRIHQPSFNLHNSTATILSNTDGYGGFTKSSLRITDNIWIQVAVESDDAGDLEP